MRFADWFSGKKRSPTTVRTEVPGVPKGIRPQSAKPVQNAPQNVMGADASPGNDPASKNGTRRYSGPPVRDLTQDGVIKQLQAHGMGREEAEASVHVALVLVSTMSTDQIEAIHLSKDPILASTLALKWAAHGVHNGARIQTSPTRTDASGIPGGDSWPRKKCWYCGVTTADIKPNLKSMQHLTPAMAGQYERRVITIEIPRCKTCQNGHGKLDKAKIVWGAAIPAVVFLLFIAIMFLLDTSPALNELLVLSAGAPLVGFWVYYFAAYRRRIARQYGFKRAELDCRDYPEAKHLISKGWSPMGW